MIRRHYIGTRHYPSYAPRVLWHRFIVHRTLVGPLMGCSCTRCFKHPWRLAYSRETVRDRVRIAELEKRVRKLERPERTIA